MRKIFRTDPVAKAQLSRVKKVDFSYDCASGNISKELAQEFCVHYGKSHSNLDQVGMLPFTQRHGHEIADKHFSRYESLLQREETLSAKQLAQAVNSRQAKINEINRREGKPEVYVNAIHSPLPKTKSIRKPQIEIPGIQSSKGISWFRSDGKILNHIYPDVSDRKCGLQVHRGQPMWTGLRPMPCNIKIKLVTMMSKP